MKRIIELFSAILELLKSLAILPKVLHRAIVSLFNFLEYVLRKLSGKKKYKRKNYKKCFRLPAEISRWPDPCIYSQRYLRARGFSVTWNNPDIEITDLEGNPVPSGDLQANSNYVVNARIHNASFDPALAVRVGCTVRKWGIETDDRVPIELDHNGSPIIKTIHIEPWGSTIARFNWHTPDVERKHICIEVKCSHPNDRVVENNVGQENTTVTRAAPGTSFQMIVPFYNPQETDQEFRLWADEFEIPDGKISLDLQKVGNIKRSASQAINPSKVVLPSVYEKGMMSKSNNKGKFSTYAYASSDNFRDTQRNSKNSLDPDWKVQIKDENESGQNSWLVKIPAKTTLDLSVDIQVPTNAQIGESKVINISARDSVGITVGGVSIHIKIT